MSLLAIGLQWTLLLLLVALLVEQSLLVPLHLARELLDATDNGREIPDVCCRIAGKHGIKCPTLMKAYSS
jgi:hypothetical protein